MSEKARLDRAKRQDCWGLTNLAMSGGPEEKYKPRVLLYGLPGTGKSTAAQRMGKTNGVFNVTLTEETPAAEIRGHYVPIKGEFQWKDGPGISAVRNGARLVLNEIDHASGDVHTLLMALLDDHETLALTLPTGETITHTDGYQVIATMNGVPSDLPDALRDRFEIMINVDKPNPDALKILPTELRNAAKGTVAHRDPARALSLRSWIAFDRLSKVHSKEEAAVLVFGQKQAQAVLDSIKIGKA